MTWACIHSIRHCFLLIGVRVEDDCDTLGIENYPIVVRVCFMKYAYGVILLTWPCYVFGDDTQPGVGLDPEYVVFDSSS